jgi:hypothetical protein
MRGNRSRPILQALTARNQHHLYGRTYHNHDAPFSK